MTARTLDPALHGGLALFTDLYELTMLQAYLDEGLTAEAVFSLSARRLPEQRNFLLACGLDGALRRLETLRFEAEDLAYLATLGKFSERFRAWLGAFRFSGRVDAVPEGTPVFADEPILEITASLPQAQLVETLVLNQIGAQTALASKAQRIVAAAGGRPVIDFGARRAQGLDAATLGARAFWIAGIAATSNVLAGSCHGIPLAGTMAHSYVQAHDDEAAAFRAFAARYPDTVLLVDTYDTLTGVGRVIELARALGEDFAVRAIRLDSGDLLALSRQARARLDAAGLQRVGIFASSNLDEHAIAALLAAGAPIDSFGVGTSLAVSADAPALDTVYKLCQYAGRGRLKLSTDKPVLPGRKQVYRHAEGDRDMRDTIARAGEDLPGRPLLRPVMAEGRRLAAGNVALEDIRRYAADQIARLPDAIRGLAPADPSYPVELSPALTAHVGEVSTAVAG